MDEQEDGLVWDGEACEGCGNDDGPYRFGGRWLCLDCLEAEDELEDGDVGTPVVVHDHAVGRDFDEPAVDPNQVDPIYLPRLGGLT